MVIFSNKYIILWTDIIWPIVTIITLVRSSGKRRSISPVRGGRPSERMGVARDVGRNADEQRGGVREEGVRAHDSAGSRDQAINIRDRERRPRDIAERDGSGYGGRSAGVYGPSAGGGNRPRSPPRGSASDSRYGPGRGDRGGRIANAYGPGTDRDRVGQAPNRQQGMDRGGARRRSPSPNRRRRSPSPVRGGARAQGPVRGTYQPMRRDAVRESRDRGRGRRSPSRSRDRRRSPSSSRSSSRSSRSSSSRSAGSRSSSSSRSRGDRKGPSSRGRSSSASSSSRSRSPEPDSKKKHKETGEKKNKDGKGDEEWYQFLPSLDCHLMFYSVDSALIWEIYLPLAIFLYFFMSEWWYTESVIFISTRYFPWDGVISH